MIGTLTMMIDKGGFSTWLIFLSGALLIVLGIERAYVLFLKLSYNTREALDSIRTQVMGRKYPEALQVCNVRSSAPELQVVKSALLAVENGREAMRSSLGGAVLEVSGRVEARLPFVALIASVATLLGLLGTITGLIGTFAAIGKADAATKAQMLGDGISEAMYSTAAGLIVGITAMVLHTVFTSRADRIVARAQDAGLKVVTWVEQAERGGGKAK
jgi:biopolymer transport protein ExbB/TolQ